MACGEREAAKHDVGGWRDGPDTGKCGGQKQTGFQALVFLKAGLNFQQKEEG